MNSSIIECISLSKEYSNRSHTVKAVNDVNLQIIKNEFVLLKGSSGAGKSSLLNLMCGLDKPTHGKVMIENEDINILSNKELSKLLLNKVGIIFQNFNLLPTYTVYENIELALVPSVINKEHAKEIILPLLKQLKLEDKINFLPSELSVGQQQKVAIARTLAKNPTIIFADEPTGSVDDDTAKEIIENLLQLKKNKGITIVVATHGSFPVQYADRIIRMKDGQIV